ncbi:MAG: glycosyltransferase family 4 protein [Patescibacteria group bacterium]|nr:glycosyltransferase family 4 protein [Patescibacteria group bacterium]
MKRVLMFSLVYLPRFVGGAELAIKDITDRIPADEIQFDMITLRLDSSLPAFERVGNINVYRIGWAGKIKGKLPLYLHLNKYAMLFTAYRKAKKLDKQNNYDVIWSVMATYNSFAAVIFKILNPNKKFLLTLQDGDPIAYIKRRALPLYPLFKKIFTRADHIQAISNYLADWAKAMGAKCPISVIPNGVDFEMFSRPIVENRFSEVAECEDTGPVNNLFSRNTPSRSAELGASSRSRPAGLDLRNVPRKELFAGPNDTLLITASRLVPKNGVADIIQAMKYLPNNVKLVVAGSGILEKKLKQTAKEIGVADRVTFLGEIAHNELPKYFQACDIFVRPSLSEGFGSAFVEAMAAGIPVIATPVGGIVDFLRERETGLFCAVQDPKSLADAVKTLIGDAQLRSKIVENARDMVKEKYDWGKISRDMRQVL